MSWRAHEIRELKKRNLCAVVDEHGRTRHGSTADAPDKVVADDITEHKTAEGLLRLSAYISTTLFARSGRSLGI